MPSMIYTLTLNPSLDQHLIVRKLVKDDTVRAEKVRLDPGGKGLNVTRVIQELGGQSRAFAIAGGHSGVMLKQMLAERRIDHQLCQVHGTTRTNVKVAASDGSHIQIQGRGPQLTGSEVKRIRAMVERAQPRPSYWVLAGSLPPGVTPDFYGQLIKAFQKRGEKCVLDADGESLKRGINAKPFLIKPNAFELERLIGRKLKMRSQILTAARSLTQKTHVVAVTLGPKGALIVTANEAWHLTAPSGEIKSSVGAGDAFIGGFLFALDKGEDLRVASRWAIASATASIHQEGTANVRRRDVQSLIKRVDLQNC